VIVPWPRAHLSNQPRRVCLDVRHILQQVRNGCRPAAACCDVRTRALDINRVALYACCKHHWRMPKHLFLARIRCVSSAIPSSLIHMLTYVHPSDAFAYSNEASTTTSPPCWFTDLRQHCPCMAAPALADDDEDGSLLPPYLRFSTQCCLALLV
jgi:hypothetical protein